MEYFNPEMLLLVGGFIKAIGSALGRGIKSVAGPLISAGAQLLGGAQTASGVRATNRAQMQLAREQMDFQERMSSTAYQRAAEDLEAAGLNRILALGSPATSPHGAMATLQNPDAAMGEAITQAPHSAMAARRHAADVAAIRQTAATGKSAELLNKTNIVKMRDEMENIRAQTQVHTAEAVMRDTMAQFYEMAGPTIMGLLDKVFPKLGIGALFNRATPGGKKVPQAGPKPKARLDKAEKIQRARPKKRPLPKEVQDIIRQYQ